MKGLKKTFTKKVTSVVLSVAMIFTGISVTPQTIRAEGSITATNGATVSMQDDSKTGYSAEKDGDLYNYIKYGVSVTADGEKSEYPANNVIDGSADTRWANEDKASGHWIMVDN